MTRGIRDACQFIMPQQGSGKAKGTYPCMYMCGLLCAALVQGFSNVEIAKESGQVKQHIIYGGRD